MDGTGITNVQDPGRIIAKNRQKIEGTGTSYERGEV